MGSWCVFGIKFLAHFDGRNSTLFTQLKCLISGEKKGIMWQDNGLIISPQNKR